MPKKTTHELLHLQASPKDIGKLRGFTEQPGMGSDGADAFGTDVSDGNDVLEFFESEVKVAPFTDSYPLLPLYEATERNPPPEVVVANNQGYDYYMVKLVFSILLKDDVYARRASLQLVIQDDAKDKVRKTRVTDYFPRRTDRAFFTCQVDGGVCVDFDLGLVVPSEGPSPMPLGRINADAHLKGGFLLGPFAYEFKRTELEVVGALNTTVQWRYRTPDLLNSRNEIPSFLLLKVPREVQAVSIHASLRVSPYKAQWIVFDTALPELQSNGRLAVEL